MSFLLALVLSLASPASPDVNGDGSVDVADLLIMLDQWGSCDRDCTADLTQDGFVDVSDLLMLLADWGPWIDEAEPVGGLMELFLPTSESGIELASNQVPFWMVMDTFSVAAWLRPTQSGTANAVSVDGVFSLLASEDTTTFQIHGNNMQPPLSIAAEGGALDEWRLVLASWTPATGQAKLYVVSAAIPDGVGVTTVDGTFVPGSTSGLLRIGTPVPAQLSQAGEAVSGWVGHLGCITLRRNVESTLPDAVAMCNSKDALAPLMYVGHQFLGLEDDALAVNIGMVMAPNGVGVTAVNGATFGSPIVSGNYLTYRYSPTLNPEDSLRRARPVTVHGDLVYGNHHDVQSGFFQRTPPGFTIDGVAGNSEVAARLGRNEKQGLTRIGVWSNSRGMRRLGGYVPPAGFPDYYRLPGSHGNGFIAACLDRDPSSVVGVIGAYLHHAGTGGASTRRQFIFDAVGGPYRSGIIDRLGPMWNDFRRFWTGSGSGDYGPGDALRMGSDSVYSFKAKDEPPTLATRTNPLVIRMSYLKYPGGGNFQWEHVRAASQSSSGSATGPAGAVYDADTSRYSFEFDEATDSYDAQSRTLVLPFRSSVQRNWAVYFSGDDGASIAEVENVVVENGGTVLTLRHAFETAPLHGSLLLIGPWEYGSVQYTAPATTFEYRGPRVTTEALPHGPVILLSYSAWVEAADGFAFGAFGWGGNGYKPQREHGVEYLPAKIAAHLELDAMFLHGAYQQSTPIDMTVFANDVEAHSQAQAVLLSDMAHAFGISTTATWANYIRAQTLHAGSVATEATGAYDQLIASGEKMDRAHPSLQGMKTLAGNHLDMFRKHFGTSSIRNEILQP